MVVQHNILMRGSTPEPLALDGLHAGSLGHYLAALGVLRVASQMEGCIEVRGSWQNSRFLLHGSASTFNRESLCTYLCKNWKPARFERWWTEAQAASKTNADAIPKVRASEPDERVDQLDAVMVQADRRVFNDVFGTGGNIGKRDLAAVWKRCLELSKQPDQASLWLAHTLFGTEDVSLPQLKGAGTWFVFSNKTFNSGQDWYREGRLSPWSFLLAMEGALLLRGGVHRRLGTRTKDKAVFPFMCRPMEPPTDGQVAHGRSEFWAPLWSKPGTMLEIEALFRAGLAEVGGRPASAPHEFAVAALDAAVDAGVSAFVRFELRQTTSAQVFEALPHEWIQVRRHAGRRHSRLLLPLITSDWIDRLPYEPKDSKQRGRFVGLRGPVEAATVRVSEDPDDPERWQSLLLLLARTQGRVDRTKALRKRCNPVPLLHPEWFDKAWPEPPVEIRVARAVASIGANVLIGEHREITEYTVLFNIFGVDRTKTGILSFPEARPARAVWHDGQPVRVLIEILRRRLMDADELDPVPLRGTRPCDLNTIASFLSGEGCDDELLVRWIPPLSLLDWNTPGTKPSYGTGVCDYPLHPLYSLSRPLLDPDGLSVRGRMLFPPRDDDSRKPHTAAARTLVNRILQNQLDQAVNLARRRYFGAGWRTFESPPLEMEVDCERLAAALLVPVSPTELAARVGRDWLVLSTQNR